MAVFYELACAHSCLTLAFLVGGGDQPAVLPKCPLDLAQCQPQPVTVEWHIAAVHHPRPGSSVGAAGLNDLHQ